MIVVGDKNLKVRRLTSVSGRIGRGQKGVNGVGCQEVGGFYIDDELNVMGETEIMRKEKLQNKSLVELYFI